VCSPSPPRLTNSNDGDRKRGDQHFFHVNACSLQNLRPNQFSAVGQGWLRNTRARWRRSRASTPQHPESFRGRCSHPVLEVGIVSGRVASSRCVHFSSRAFIYASHVFTKK
jgi:hypothetical protein